MTTYPKSSNLTMRKYYQLLLVIVCFLSIVTLLIYRREYYRLRYVMEVLNMFGKPGLSEAEYCGAGFNATLLTEIMRNTSMEVRETPPLFQQIDENFYTYSAFLRSYEKYDRLVNSPAHITNTIAVGKLDVKPNFQCKIWLENNDKPKSGKFSYTVVHKSTKNLTLFVFQCSMMKNFGKPNGVSFFMNDYTTSPYHAPVIKLIEVNNKHKPRMMANIRFVNFIDPAICVVPNQVPIVSKDSFIQFLVFHHILGVKTFTIYDSMISEDIVKRLKLLPAEIADWDITFFPLNYPSVFTKSYEIMRSAVELDCMFRHFRIDKEEMNRNSHITVLSWDEYLVPRMHTSLKAIIDELDPTRKLKSLQIAKPLLFCLNQNDDDNADILYPDIIKKTHFYLLPQSNRTTVITNLDVIKNLDDFYSQGLNKQIPIEVLGIHKYTECGDQKTYHISGSGYNDEQMQVFQHKFEGAMLKFGQNILSNTVYKIYRSGKLWDKSDQVRDML